MMDHCKIHSTGLSPHDGSCYYCQMDALERANVVSELVEDDFARLADAARAAADDLRAVAEGLAAFAGKLRELVSAQAEAPPASEGK